ncbi:ABC-F family ATP-binding cassette domain-containing protein [Chloracidobacterium sp. D]|uniref:ABC-F family ATP-binding cassette domain-containing protein n=1 Tax=Chloracidobacterium sp. D TaxID=2821536 RepID=UPI001B8CC00A|nr:ABC-F family ATP-binding cassette domain-containing protein [Chloracidobacterium sp. D]QUV80904.1 ABC-F family ATP-binding cassette domain-containing protein [Chloracidobacterium sp. D]
MLFRFEDVHKSYGGHDILRGVTCQVNPGEKIGLVGRNGAGKSTMLRLLCGLDQPDRGQIIRATNLSFGLLEQHPHFPPEVTVLEAALSVFSALQAMEREMRQLEHAMAEPGQGSDCLADLLERYSELQHRFEEQGGFTYPARTEEVLLGLGLTREDFSKPAVRLSGGQQGRLHLGMLLLRQPDLLLLDEPTNHLDLRAIEWLEEFLTNYAAAYLVISHDRFFLDRVTTRTIELDRGKTTSYTGGFTEYVAKRDALREIQQRHYEKQQEEIARQEEFIRRNIAGQKTKQAKSRRNLLARMERIEAATVDAPQGNFSMKHVPRSGEWVLTLEDLRVGYGGKAVAGPFNLVVRRGERLGIVGPNGAGKTTLLKTLLGILPPVTGTLRWGTGVKTAYYDQRLESLTLANSIFAELQSVNPSATEFELRSFLARFLFTGDDVFKPIRTLSGGERGRLALAKLIYSRSNVLILDEPTNHLDIPSCEALEMALVQYPGTCLIVSHDRYFLDNVATRLLWLEPGSSRDFDGSYSELWEIRQAEQREAARRAKAAETARPAAQPAETHAQAHAPSPAAPPAAPTGTSPGAKKKPRGKVRPVEAIESDIARAEADLATVSAAMATPEVATDPVRYSEFHQQYEKLTQRLEALYAEWELVAQASA